MISEPQITGRKLEEGRRGGGERRGGEEEERGGEGKRRRGKRAKERRMGLCHEERCPCTVVHPHDI